MIMSSALSRAFQRITITRTSLLVSKYSTTFHKNLKKNHYPPTFHGLSPNSELTNYEQNLHLAPIPQSIDLGITQRIVKKIIDNPVPTISRIIIDPTNVSMQPKEDKVTEKLVNLPTAGVQIQKFAGVSLRRIKRRQMKVHKRKKWLRKYPAIYRKQLQTKYLKEERAFRSEILEKIRAADAFDAKKYVASRLEILDNVRFPHKYLGYVLPAETIRQLMKEDEEKKNWYKNMPKLKL